jgi:hypothetical protein
MLKGGCSFNGWKMAGKWLEAVPRTSYFRTSLPFSSARLQILYHRPAPDVRTVISQLRQLRASLNYRVWQRWGTTPNPLYPRS